MKEYANIDCHVLFQNLYIKQLTAPHIGKWAFRGLRLEKLLVTLCELNVAPSIQPVAHTLRDLDLSRNDISELPLDYFYGCNMLTRISLGNNIFAAIPNLTKVCGNLEFFFMNDNRLSNIDMLYQTQFPRLKLLNLDNNDIDFFPYPKWRWPRLSTLHLQENRIKSFMPE